MRISELSKASGVPVPTIKYYLRESLLHPGESTSATRAVYDDSHVQRLKLIRALVDVGELKISAVRRVLDTLDDESLDIHNRIGSAHTLLSEGPPASRPAQARVDALMSELGWQVHPHSPHRGQLARALDALSGAELPASEEKLRTYASAAQKVAESDLSRASADSPTEAVRFVVIGTVLSEPVFLALRRLAHEDQSSRRFGRRTRKSRKQARTTTTARG